MNRLREKLALAICRADNERVPIGYDNDIDHPDVSDWGVFVADAVLSAIASEQVGEEEIAEVIRDWRNTALNAFGSIPTRTLDADRSLARAILSRLSLRDGRKNEWQPIETAPKDRRIGLLVDGEECIGRWQDDRYATKPRPYFGHETFGRHDKTEQRKHQPTHWRELRAASFPSTPTDQKEG